MSQASFGSQLRYHRLQATDPKTRKPLTQQKLGELLGLEMGDHGFSGAAVSDWERDQSRIHANDRVVLVSLIKILKQHDGIKTKAEANHLLETGNYRALNPQEEAIIFPEESHEAETSIPASSSYLQFFLEAAHFPTFAEFHQILQHAKKGPPPAWPRVWVALVRWFTDQISVASIWRMLLWIWILLIGFFLIAPSQNWDLLRGDTYPLVMLKYAVGSLILPPLIGAVTNTKSNDFWQEQNIENSLVLRLYVHQGAFVGFHVGYFLVFLPSFALSAMDVRSTFIALTTILIPISIAYAAAQLVPYNLWLAYGRLLLKDGAVFFFFVILGPLWAWFFLQFHAVFTSPIMAAFVFLTAASILVLGELRRRAKKQPEKLK